MGGLRIPQAVTDDYVALTMIKLAPVFEIKADPTGIPAMEARIRHFSLVQRAPDLATEAVMAVHADLGARGKLRWTEFGYPAGGRAAVCAARGVQAWPGVRPPGGAD